jgi:hypothetical protein
MKTEARELKGTSDITMKQVVEKDWIYPVQNWVH